LYRTTRRKDGVPSSSIGGSKATAALVAAVVLAAGSESVELVPVANSLPVETLLPLPPFEVLGGLTRAFLAFGSGFWVHATNMPALFQAVLVRSPLEICAMP